MEIQHETALLELADEHESVGRGEKSGSGAVTEASRKVKGGRWFLVVLAVLSSTFFYGLDNTVAANIQPVIVAQFDALDRLPWISAAFLVGGASTNFFWGQIYTQYDAKWVYILCVALFELGSTLCAAAPDMNTLIGGRAVCGFGGSGMYIGVMTLLSLLTSTKERATYLGLTGLTWGAGTVIGPLVGGGFASSSLSWRWAFWINLLFGAVCAPVYVWMIPAQGNPQPDRQQSLWRRLRSIDGLGTVLMIGTLTSVLMAINFGGTVYAWNSGQIIALFVTSGVLALALGFQQRYAIATTESSRSFPVHFLHNRQLCIIFLVEACASTLTFLPIYFLPLYFQFAKSLSAVESGVQVLPLVAFLVVTICGTGLLTSRYPWPMPWFALGSASALAGSALLYTINPTTSSAHVYGYSILIGFGAGCYVTLCFTVAQAHAPEGQIPFAVGFITFSQLAASAIALSIANTLFLNISIKNVHNVASELAPVEIQSLISGANSTLLASLDSSTQVLVKNTVVQSLGYPYILGIICGGGSVILCLFMEKGRMQF